LPRVNPLQEARYRAARSWRTARDGTKRTAGWVTGGVGGRIASLWRRSGGRLVHAIGSRPRVAIAWAGGGLIVLAWIGWTVYVWVENGAGAGIGVLISWPAVFAALALVASPFVGAGLLVRRHRVAADGPDVPETGESSGAPASGQPEPEAADGSAVDSEAETASDDEETADGDEASPSDEPESEEKGREPEEAKGE
jgi:hypothetical protein